MNPQRPTISKTPVPAATGQNVARKSVSFQPMPPPPNPPARGPSTIKTIAAKSGSPLGRETGGPRYIVPSKSVPRAGPSTSKVGAKSAMSTPRKSMPGTKSWSGNYGSGPQSRVYTKQVGWIPSRGGPRPQQGPARKSYAYASSNDQVITSLPPHPFLVHI
ncbi:hypothetical protein JAAARDRAFT_324789 [Jaapia argillacea MUCL 33604]|uniref:Uncharacterized protein n=1 Tax=Jaapia argillacea MUCL 33604 TaxID=933084 RepID=A0A067PL68_9AGAM|nr:hypothetical protein JAAARDRAFT_324789 [Jaapia argillacea MUCL 33604]